MFGGLVYGVDCWSGGTGLAEGYGGTDMNVELSTTTINVESESGVDWSRAVDDAYSEDAEFTHLVDRVVRKVIVPLEREAHIPAAMKELDSLFGGVVPRRTLGELAQRATIRAYGAAGMHM